MGIEAKAKYFRDDTRNRVRQIRIIPKDVSFRNLHSLARHQFRTSEEMECIMITPKGRLIISPEYVRSVQALPYQQTLDHILETALEMRRASSIHIVYKAPSKSK